MRLWVSDAQTCLGHRGGAMEIERLSAYLPLDRRPALAAGGILFSAYDRL